MNELTDKKTLYSSRIPVCVRVCRLRSKASLNPFPQIVHKYLLTSLWHLTWRLNSRQMANFFPQTRHMTLSSGVFIPSSWGFTRRSRPWFRSGFFTP